MSEQIELAACEESSGEVFIELRGIGEWENFAVENEEILIEQYGGINAAFAECCRAGLVIGGGAAPIFNITFVEA